MRIRPEQDPGFGLVSMGAGARLVVAALVVAAIWTGFLWATATPGAL